MHNAKAIRIAKENGMSPHQEYECDGYLIVMNTASNQAMLIGQGEIPVRCALVLLDGIEKAGINVVEAFARWHTRTRPYAYTLNAILAVEAVKRDIEKIKQDKETKDDDTDTQRD